MSFAPRSRILGRATTAIAFIGLTSCRGGCSNRCTEAACSDGLEIQFEPALSAPGRYEFKVDLDGVTRRCEASLPRSGQQEPMTDCIIHGSNGALTLITIHDVQPRVVALRVERNQAAIVDTRVTPNYEIRRPNGPGCPPQCSVARVTAKIKEPTPGVHP